jgi:hypothetical protein
MAYQQASRAQSDAAARLIMERRLGYELDLLRDLADQFVGGPNRDGWFTRMRLMLLTLQGDKDLPLLRALVAPSTAHRAIADLTLSGAVTASRGRRAIVS